MENWKAVVGFEGVYEVSDQGHVKRIKKGRGARAGALLTPRNHTAGYLAVHLCVNNERTQCLIHRLVAEAFHGPSPKGQVNHKNGIKTDNRVSNLEWATPAENNKHARNSEERRKGLTAYQAKEIREDYASGKYDQQDLADMYGVSQNQISLVVMGKAWADAGGPITKTGQGKKQRKLSEETVRQIRDDKADGMTYSKLAVKYSMARTTILQLIQGKTYKDVK